MVVRAEKGSGGLNVKRRRKKKKKKKRKKGGMVMRIGVAGWLEVEWPATGFYVAGRHLCRAQSYGVGKCRGRCGQGREALRP